MSTTRFTFGFDRETFALVPRHTGPSQAYTCEDTSHQHVADDLRGEAMTVTAVNRVHVVGLRDIDFGHVIATGEPAVAIAKDGTQFKAVADRIFKEEDR